jgi:hypothetical protein
MDLFDHREHYPIEMYYVNGDLYNYDEIRKLGIVPHNTVKVLRQRDGKLTYVDKEGKQMPLMSKEELLHVLRNKSRWDTKYRLDKRYDRDDRRNYDSRGERGRFKVVEKEKEKEKDEDGDWMEPLIYFLVSIIFIMFIGFAAMVMISK